MPEDGKQPSSDTATIQERPAPPTASARRLVRAVLLALGPILVLGIAAYVYVNTGRYVETENAYVKAGATLISPRVSGPIVKVAVRENEVVHKGDVLFEIDDRSYSVAVDQAGAQLATIRSFIESLEASYRQQLERLKLARTNVEFTSRELAREQSLAERRLGSEADVDTARHDFDVATQEIPIIEQSLEQLRAQLGSDLTQGLEGHSAYRAAKAMLEKAELELEHTVVRAPFDGIASNVPATGLYVMPGTPVMGVISSTAIWIEANYKETELTYVDVGQPVRIRVDTYPDLEWRGTVESISPATGAEFSVIPAQNASGNWVKVAQRITVRIALELRPQDPALRAGMSAVVEVDTGHDRPVPAVLRFLRRPARAEHPAAGGPPTR